jgi:hypothetical protein
MRIVSIELLSNSRRVDRIAVDYVPSSRSVYRRPEIRTFDIHTSTHKKTGRIAKDIVSPQALRSTSTSAIRRIELSLTIRPVQATVAGSVEIDESNRPRDTVSGL